MQAIVKQHGSTILLRLTNSRALHVSSVFRKKKEHYDEDGEKLCIPYKVADKKVKDEYNYEYYDEFTCKANHKEKKERRPNCWANRKALSDRKYCPVSHIIFNLDGVVLNTEEMIQNAHRKFLKRFNKKYTRDLRLRASGLSELDAAKLILDETGIPLAPEVYAHGMRQFVRTWLPSSNRIKGVYDLICHFRVNKIPIALASSSDERAFNLKTKCHPNTFDKFCHVTLSSDEGVKAGKPNPDIMHVSAKKFRGGPSDMTKYLAIEDSLAGAIAARAAGMQVLMLTSRFVTKDMAQKVADMVIDEFEDLDLTEFSLPNIPRGVHYA